MTRGRLLRVVSITGLVVASAAYWAFRRYAGGPAEVLETCGANAFLPKQELAVADLSALLAA